MCFVACEWNFFRFNTYKTRFPVISNSYILSSQPSFLSLQPRFLIVSKPTFTLRNPFSLYSEFSFYRSSKPSGLSMKSGFSDFGDEGKEKRRDYCLFCKSVILSVNRSIFSSNRLTSASKSSLLSLTIASTNIELTSDIPKMPPIINRMEK